MIFPPARVAVLLLVAVSSQLPAPVARAQANYEIVAVGGMNGPGARPSGGVVLAPDGNYYGTASEGGAFGGGTVFRLAPDGTLTNVVSFPYEQGKPTKALTVGSDGNLYGTTTGQLMGEPNSKGTIFRVTLAGQLTTLATFTNPPSASPILPQQLVEASDGNLYGATSYGGAQGGGELFRLTKEGTLTTLVTFTGANGSVPSAGMIEGSDGNLYGTTLGGGAHGGGTVYRLTQGGVFTTIASFPLSGDLGRNPAMELTQGTDGSLYGVTSVGFANSAASAFRVTLDGVFTTLGRMPSTSSPPTSPLVFGDDGNLYGTTAAHYYRVSPTGGGLSVVLNFNSRPEGREARGPLLKVGNGEFLATTFAGAGSRRFGVVHRLTEQGGAITVAAFPRPLGRGFNSELSEGRDGQLFGTTKDDRSALTVAQESALGAFRFDLIGAIAPLNTMPTFYGLDYPHKSSRLVAAPDGNLYGAVSFGGMSTGNEPPNTSPTGFIYRINANDQPSTAFQFVGFGDGSPNQTGDAPKGALVLRPDSQLYGTAALGGAHGRGTFFKLDLAGNLSVLHSFDEASPVGGVPRGDLILIDGLFYGLTSSGGANGKGTFFSASPDGQVTPIVAMPADRNFADDSRLILAADGHFYGVFYDGGANNRGSVFRLTKSGVLTTFADMNAETGSGPVGVMQANDGNFYGVTYTFEAHGSIFRIEPNGTVAVLARFDDEKGTAPRAAPMQASDGNLYGTCLGGGPSLGGVIYRLALAGAAPSPTPTPTATPQLSPVPSASPTPEPSASPSPSSTATPQPSASPTPAAAPARMGNIATRLRVETGSNVLIGGIIITGTQPKKVIVRAIGPSAPVEGTLSDPQLEMFDGAGTSFAFNDNWQEAANAQEIIDSTVAPTHAAEAAFLGILEPGVYTAVVSGAHGTTGVGVVEAYDLDGSVDSKFANIATRGFVQTGGDVMIGGLIIVGNDQQKVIVRAIGPSLPVDGKLADPTLDLIDGNGESVAFNNNWRETQQTEIEATTIPPSHDLESAIVATLPPGSYTAVVRGAGDTTGVALVEFYALQ